MVVEHAEIFVTPGREAEFEAAMTRAKDVALQADGIHSFRCGRGIESPSVFRLTIEWETLEAHTEGFRGSELFTQWRGVIGEFFEQPPRVEHSETFVEA